MKILNYYVFIDIVPYYLYLLVFMAYNQNEDCNKTLYNESSDSETYDSKEVLGTSGLHNMGNTCYMSSVLQCLSNCEIFRNYILSSVLLIYKFFYYFILLLNN